MFINSYIVPKSKFEIQNDELTGYVHEEFVGVGHKGVGMKLFSPDSCPYGVSYSEWTARWWQWILSIPVQVNPSRDTTGKYSDINQNGPVWFLASTTGGVAHRTYKIPSGFAILVPILNHGGTLADEPTIRNVEELALFARKEMDVISDLEVTIDNSPVKELQKYRVQSPVFDVILPDNNLFNGIPGPTRGAADGYWLFIEPPPSGMHSIRSFGSCLAGKIKIGLVCEIQIM